MSSGSGLSLVVDQPTAYFPSGDTVSHSGNTFSSPAFAFASNAMRTARARERISTSICRIFLGVWREFTPRGVRKLDAPPLSLAADAYSLRPLPFLTPTRRVRRFIQGMASGSVKGEASGSPKVKSKQLTTENTKLGSGRSF